MARHQDAAQRVRARINDWVARGGHGSKAELAKAVGAKYGDTRKNSWVTGILNGPDKRGQDLRLKDLDAVADAMDVPPGELVRKHDRNFLELTMGETRLLRWFRLLPFEAREGILKLVTLFVPKITLAPPALPDANSTYTLVDRTGQVLTTNAASLTRPGPDPGRQTLDLPPIPAGGSLTIEDVDARLVAAANYISKLNELRKAFVVPADYAPPVGQAGSRLDASGGTRHLHDASRRRRKGDR